MKPSVILTRRWPAQVEQKLHEHFEVSVNHDDIPFSTEQYRAAIKEHDAVLSTVTDNLDCAVFNPLSHSDVRAKIIGNYGVGFSHIDLEHARRLNLTVSNTPDVLSECTADIAMMLILMVARRAGEGERELRGDDWTGWRPTHMVGQKVSGKTLGIIGFGRIGKETAKRALGFGMKIIVQNRSVIAEEVLAEFGATRADTIEELLQASDFVSLHCPGGVDNLNLIDSEKLRLMKPGAFLINTARGEIIDEGALVAALKSGRIGGAGLDVYCNEPAVNPELKALENVVLLPHLGSATASTRDAMGFRVVENLLAFFNGCEPPDKVA